MSRSLPLRSPLLWVVLVAVLGFAVFPACFAPTPPRDTGAPEVDTPAAGPDQPSGGQWLDVPAGDQPADRARRALEQRGWTVHPSTRDDELIGRLAANVAIIRWSGEAWWCRVEQRSDFQTGRRVPPWDHPWEAMRLLHLACPAAGPVRGWQAWDSDLGPPLTHTEAVALFGRGGQLDVATIGRWVAWADELDADGLRTVLQLGYQAAVPDSPHDLLPASLTHRLGGRQSPVLARAISERRDPYTHYPATTTFPADSILELELVLVTDPGCLPLVRAAGAWHLGRVLRFLDDGGEIDRIRHRFPIAWSALRLIDPDLPVPDVQVGRHRIWHVKVPEWWDLHGPSILEELRP